MSGTHLFYNGVLMRDCDLREWDQVFERDQSDTDLLFNRVRLTVSSTLVSLHSTNPNEALPPKLGDTTNPLTRQHLSTIAIESVDGETVVDRLLHIQRQLQEPRKDCWLAINAVSNKPLVNNKPNQYTPADKPDSNDSYRIVLAATGVGTFDKYNSDTHGRVVEGKISGAAKILGATDVDRDKVIDMNNGPKPMNVRVERIAGGRAMSVVFTVEVCRRLCPPVDNNPQTGFDKNGDPDLHPIYDAGKVEGVLSNRWGLAETMDESWQTTHEIQGTLRVADQRYKPHAMRMVVTPALFPYGKLTHRAFAVDKTGLVLEYSFSIQEAGYSPPPGVIDWSGSYTESNMYANSQRVGDLSVTVKAAHKDDDQNRNARMLIALHDIARSRIAGMDIRAPLGVDGMLRAQGKPTTVMQKISISEQLGKPEMTLRATVLHVDRDISQWSLRVDQLGTPMVIQNYDHRYWPLPEAYPWQQPGPEEDSANLGSYFNQYFQSPCSQWHAMPRGSAIDPVVEVTRESSAVNPPMKAYQLGDVDATVGLNHLPSLQGVNHSWSDVQMSDTTYLSWDGDDTYDTDVGMLHLPLSKPRNRATSAVIPVHAGLARRTLTVVASRLKQLPEIPIPNTVVGIESGLPEQLLHHTLVAQNAELQADGVTLLHSLKIAYHYGLNRPVGSQGYTSDKYRRPSSPMDLSRPELMKIDPMVIQTVGTIESA